jgi:hypothetical protein
MLPFVAALGLFLTWRTWHTRGDAAAVRASASRLAVFCLVTVAIAGWWYANNLIVYGDIVGSNDATGWVAMLIGVAFIITRRFFIPERRALFPSG